MFAKVCSEVCSDNSFSVAFGMRPPKSLPDQNEFEVENLKQVSYSRKRRTPSLVVYTAVSAACRTLHIGQTFKAFVVMNLLIT